MPEALSLDEYHWKIRGCDSGTVAVEVKEDGSPSILPHWIGPIVLKLTVAVTLKKYSLNLATWDLR